ncbi:MAG: O-methyltransferase [Firmicutes bacterium]|nr:O-methyltransferase [Bacillota bacterium]
MNITNKVVTEYINGFYKERTTALCELRKEAEENHVPIILRDTEDLLESLVLLKKPTKILEIGAAVGYSSSFFASLDENIKVTTIEADEKTYETAKSNIKKLGYEDRVTILFGDAREVLENLAENNDKDYDLVFIDAAKSHYKAFWDLSMPILKDDALVICDNILMKGMTASDEFDVKKKYKTSIRKMRDFLDYINSLDYAKTTTLSVGDGITISVLNK